MISTKGRYAIRFMIDLAEQSVDTPVPLDETAARQEISKKYLEIIVKILVRGKLVKGTSGKGGGYLLMRKPEDVRRSRCGKNLITSYTTIFSISR